MRISQAIKLGHRSLVGHKRRNLTTIIIIGAMFGFMMGVIFLTQGVQNAVRRAADDALGDNYYVGIETDFWNENQCHDEPIPDQPNAFEIICKEHDLVALEQKVETLGGEIIALSKGGALPISPAGAQPFLKMEMSSVPDVVVPVLESSNTLMYSLFGDNTYRFNYSDIANYVRDGTIAGAIGKTHEIAYNGGATLMTAGIIPSGSIRMLMKGDGMSLNPLDYILDFMSKDSNIGSGEMVVDNKSPATQEYLDRLNAQESVAVNMIQAVLRFDSFEQAQAFADENACQVSENSMGCKKEFFLENIFDNRVSMERTNQMIWWGLGIAEAVLLILAVIITLLTLLKVLHGEDKTITLYRSLGASTGDIVMIYLAYALEVCILAVGLAVIIGLAMALLISFTNASDMSDMLTAAYYQNVDWSIILVGWNFDIAKIILIMICVAPLALLLCVNTFRKR